MAVDVMGSISLQRPLAVSIAACGASITPQLSNAASCAISFLPLEIQAKRRHRLSPLCRKSTANTKQLYITDFSKDVVANENRQSYYCLEQEMIPNLTSDGIVPRNALAIPSEENLCLLVSLLGIPRAP